MGSISEDPITIDEEGDKNDLLPLSSPDIEQPIDLPRLLRGRSFGTTLENVPNDKN